jgi:hypothetical protein
MRKKTQPRLTSPREKYKVRRFGLSASRSSGNAVRGSVVAEALRGCSKQTVIDNYCGVKARAPTRAARFYEPPFT